MVRVAKIFASSIVMFAMSGCAGGKKSNDPKAVVPSNLPAMSTRARAIDPPEDAKPDTQKFTRLDIYVITVPFSTISGNDDFWKRVDETAVPPETYDVLYKNGMRVGLASIAEWDYFRDIINQHPATSRQGEFAGEASKSLEMQVQRDIDSETIFYFDLDNNMKGQTFGRCENLISLTFQLAPRDPGAVRVAMVPMIRSLKTRLEYNAQNVGNEISYVAPERLFDLGIRAQIPADRFLLITPSPEGRWPTSIGSTFLTASDNAERLERVILLVPRTMIGQRLN